MASFPFLIIYEPCLQKRVEHGFHSINNDGIIPSRPDQAEGLKHLMPHRTVIQNVSHGFADMSGDHCVLKGRGLLAKCADFRVQLTGYTVDGNIAEKDMQFSHQRTKRYSRATIYSNRAGLFLGCVCFRSHHSLLIPSL